MVQTSVWDRGGNACQKVATRTCRTRSAIASSPTTLKARIADRAPAGGPTCEGLGGRADGRGPRVLLRLGYCMTTQAAILVKLDVEALTDHNRAGYVDDKSLARLMSGTLGDSLGQLGQDRADAHRSRRGVQVAWSAVGRGRCPAPGSRRRCNSITVALTRTERNGDDAGVGQCGVGQLREPCVRTS